MATNRSQAKRRRLLVAAASVGDALDVEMAEEAPARITGMLEGRKTGRTTVTGMPGIGKSIFFGYFLKRYSFENVSLRS
ncbi:hypothetical protein PC113_g18340 [Phytophthora cactorum]|uniref:Uncharacterized protein n=1 Tax=Phytophthora cactorum TaxID=29920 RepID=A0A8T0YNQ0_9STRA|nr:hypothetical protein PC111_g17315 [Phytophthora cactorum]KAG2844677.1 hypothetical protein PC113_g18340 [Phytophthora cactorum]KAG2895436.1 hypothetical protein PC115_g17828 [Phytophthora cactorum]